MKRPSQKPNFDTFGRYLPVNVREEDKRRAYTLRHLNKRYGRPATFGASSY